MQYLLKLSFLLLVAMLIATPLVHATSIVNTVGMNTPISIVDLSVPTPDPQYWYTQSFTTLGDGLNLTSIVLPLTRFTNTAPGNATYAPGAITVEIRAILPGSGSYGQFWIGHFPIVSTVINPGFEIPVSNDSLDIFWLQINITATLLAPGTPYALCVTEEWAPYNQTGCMWWANANYGSLGNENYAYFYNANLTGFQAMPLSDPAAVGNAFAFGFQLIESTSTFSGVMINAPLFVGFFLCLGMGIIGFGMSKGKEPLAAIFMIEFGVFISYMLTWFPAWILASSIAVLAIILAYRFRGALSHG